MFTSKTLIKKGIPNQSVCCAVLVFSILTLLSSSCINLRNNYLGKAEREVIIPEIGIGKLAALDSVRKSFEKKEDSILHVINQRKHKNRHLTASEINQLYANFGDQLDYDRVFNILLHRKNRRNDHLSEMERYAGTRLLVSASRYTSSYGKNHVVRRNLNRGDRAHNIPPAILSKSRNYLYSPFIRKALANHTDSIPDKTDSLLQTLPHTNILKSLYYRLSPRSDIIYSFFYNLIHHVGHQFLYKEPDPFYHRPTQRKYALKLMKVLQPYDILLMKSPGLLNNELIPGYFGHASFWLGAEGKRKRKSGNYYSRKVTIHTKGMAEAIKSGVKMSSLRNYAEGDIYLILRIKDISITEKELILEHTASQIGKDYDFNFDLESPDEINCTEFVYLAYDFINWKGENYLGRYTIFPDDLLTTAQDNRRFEIVAIMKNGALLEHPDIVAVKAAMAD